MGPLREGVTQQTWGGVVADGALWGQRPVDWRGKIRNEEVLKRF